MLTLAGSDMDPEDAYRHLAHYAETFAGTVRHYDYGGDLGRTPLSSDGVTLADFGRLLIINGGPTATDVVNLMRPLDEALWAAVPQDADFRHLPDNPTKEPVYEALTALNAAFRDHRGVGPTKATKLLHLKRPRLMPIIDSVVFKAYRPMARQVARECGSRQAMFWAAVWRDARANAEQMTDMTASLADGSDAESLVARLPLLRLHDILVWSRFHAPGAAPAVLAVQPDMPG